jgi:plasmid stability protein
MDTTIRNLNEELYRALRARAVLEKRTTSDLLNEAIRGYLARVPMPRRSSSLRELKPEPYPPGNEGLSLEIDAVVYGERR